MVRAGDAAVMSGFTRQVEWIGLRLFTPASLAVLAFGIIMVAVNEAWRIGQFWVILGLVGIAITAVTGGAFFGPEARRISQILRDRGAEDPEVRRRLARVVTLGRLDLAILVLIVADMVLKPGA